MSGSGKGPHGWFKLEQVNFSYDHPTDGQLDHALNIDFVNVKEGLGARVAVEAERGVCEETRRDYSGNTIMWRPGRCLNLAQLEIVLL